MRFTQRTDMDRLKERFLRFNERLIHLSKFLRRLSHSVPFLVISWNRKQKLRGKITATSFGIFLALIGVSLAVGGTTISHGLKFDLHNLASDVWANLAVDFLGTAIAILIIDRLNENREMQRTKSQLVRQLRSDYKP